MKKRERIAYCVQGGNLLRLIIFRFKQMSYREVKITRLFVQLITRRQTWIGPLLFSSSVLFCSTHLTILLYRRIIKWNESSHSSTQTCMMSVRTENKESMPLNRDRATNISTHSFRFLFKLTIWNKCDDWMSMSMLIIRWYISIDRRRRQNKREERERNAMNQSFSSSLSLSFLRSPLLPFKGVYKMNSNRRSCIQNSFSSHSRRRQLRRRITPLLLWHEHQRAKRWTTNKWKWPKPSWRNWNLSYLR